MYVCRRQTVVMREGGAYHGGPRRLHRGRHDLRARRGHVRHRRPPTPVIANGALIMSGHGAHAHCSTTTVSPAPRRSKPSTFRACIEPHRGKHDRETRARHPPRSLGHDAYIAGGATEVTLGRAALGPAHGKFAPRDRRPPGARPHSYGRRTTPARRRRRTAVTWLGVEGDC